MTVQINDEANVSPTGVYNPGRARIQVAPSFTALGILKKAVAEEAIRIAG